MEAEQSDVSPYEAAGRETRRQRLRLWLQMLKAVRYVENDLRERLRQGYDMTLPRFDVLAAEQGSDRAA